MPIDIITAFNRAVNSTANKTVLGYLVGHPLWIGIITTACIVLIALWFEIDGITGKVGIYLCVGIVSIFVAHDIFLTGQLRESFSAGSGTDLVKNLRPVESTFQPRVMGMPAAAPAAAAFAVPVASAAAATQNGADEFAFLRDI